MANRIGLALDHRKKAWFQPKEDITTYELALITELLFRATLCRPFEDMPEGVQRHFEVQDA